MSAVIRSPAASPPTISSGPAAAPASTWPPMSRTGRTATGWSTAPRQRPGGWTCWATQPRGPRAPARGPARGRIVNITSQHGMVGAPGHAAYAVSKAGLIQLTRQIAVEYGRDGIICNGVAPGKVVTGTPGDLSRDETTAAYVRSRTPFARFGEPEDVAAAVGFLASDEATYISGATLMVDGGWMAY